MQGRTRIVLLEPQAAETDSTGDISTTARSHARGALRTDRGGRREVEAGAELGEWDRRYEVRSVGLERIGKGWLLQDLDDGGRVFVIDAIDRPVGRSRVFVLSVVSRGGAPVALAIPVVPIVPDQQDFDPHDWDPRDWG